eukprot:UN24339
MLCLVAFPVCIIVLLSECNCSSQMYEAGLRLGSRFVFSPNSSIDLGPGVSVNSALLSLIKLIVRASSSLASPSEVSVCIEIWDLLSKWSVRTDATDRCPPCIIVEAGVVGTDGRTGL